MENSSDSESSSTSMDYILQSRSEAITNKQLNKYCRPAYKTRKLKNKGALLVLVWNFLIMSLFYYLYNTAHQLHVTQNYISVGITLPIAGWLADVYLGRYRVIQWSMWITWIGSMLNTISSVVARQVVGSSN